VSLERVRMPWPTKEYLAVNEGIEEIDQEVPNQYKFHFQISQKERGKRR
jgi:hypothetical protein